jgi:hypothetical protein
MAQDLLRQNLPPTRNLTDAATVMRFRELVRSQAIRSALEHSSDTVLAFALRAVEQVISDQSRTNRETINRLWDVLDDPHLNRALGLPQYSMRRFWPRDLRVVGVLVWPLQSRQTIRHINDKPSVRRAIEPFHYRRDQ